VGDGVENTDERQIPLLRKKEKEKKSRKKLRI